MDKEQLKAVVTRALAEDLGCADTALDARLDITASLVPAAQRSRAQIITREPGVFCGQALLEVTFAQLSSDVAIEWHVIDGDVIEANTTLVTLSGPAQALLTGERVALNFLQTLCGTATMTHSYVQAMQDTTCRLLDTRKTIPGLRVLQKYAVRVGGGHNHRMGLFDAYLIKENHIHACGSITAAVETARVKHPDKSIEVEVENHEQLQEAIEAKAHIAMLDNFSIEQIAPAVAQARNKIKLEVSGNITQQNIADYACTGIDFISVGAITKHVRALDLSMRFIRL